MAKQVQQRRDTSGNLALSVPAQGEMAFNTSRGRVHMGDGATGGGIPHANYLDAQENTFSAIDAGGSADAITLTLVPAISGYVKYQRFIFKAASNNTGAATVNVNGKGAKNIYKRSGGTLGAIAANDIISGGIYEIVYDGTQFQLTATEAASAILSVSQGDINTSTGTFSSVLGNAQGDGVAKATINGTLITLPGGQYGFFPESKDGVFGVDANGPRMSAWQIVNTTSSYVAKVGAWGMQFSSAGNAVGPTPTLGGQQRYVTSSPPFDLGDGECGGFIFLEVDQNGDPVCHYAADVPPWAYNGPTRIICDHRCPLTGKKYTRVAQRRTLEEYMDGAKFIYELQEITQAIKNADMDLLPTPFTGVKPGNNVVLIDPMDKRVRSLIEYQNQGGGEEIIKAILDKKISCDNEPLKNRRGPKGLMQAKLKFKYSG